MLGLREFCLSPAHTLPSTQGRQAKTTPTISAASEAVGNARKALALAANRLTDEYANMEADNNESRPKTNGQPVDASPTAWHPLSRRLATTLGRNVHANANNCGRRGTARGRCPTRS